MLEAQVLHANLWKRLIECINGLVNEANFDCNPGGLSIQAMDTSHVALVHMLLRDDCFTKYQCERNSVLGLNLASLSKVLKIVEATDSLTLRHEDDSDVVTLTSENGERSRKCEYQLKLLEIETEAMGIPEMDYKSIVTLSSQEFAKIVRDMTVFGDTVNIEILKESVKFSSCGDVGEGYALLRASHAPTVDPRSKGESDVKTEDEEADACSVRTHSAKGKDGPLGIGVDVRTNEPITLSFALRFMNIFAKGATLSDRVSLKFAKESPCMVEYSIDQVGYLRYYLAPKVDDAE
ncbi:proliferative cell nuclear antigen (PCNA), putative [Trypanosoma equiperdum]|uniref:DNA sliding clamp PCNA n=4 Tax=Trypanozoon TaxID=39700 RepID=Q38F34_TRYB2|nr:proliferative cell nuclear antigen (PCNA),putative [Trypanosoma brucei gambiense DAL972]XP_803825.1 proliferative cell nuclear antigen [Trypanosoma brucei brucei TREU927]RHW70607.1 proliferative cell nuclear antigen (PCNA) [Trypanosoma brucei equiperdum]SCU67937.1 proliferative cell nuclear antigen (PCNA), putative [Trypanosoma equiperdum]EAN76586.1 proliferative cell nuclear antigen (PCNA), putative [Trypanosoma brucei brucei TREU927]CBH14199.1 proliferative cell nuclear antigen (PCNA),put|eukprot:XP_011776469.1 proliferative cell nuclear antigen (PCNA),putative [Trypanosoma brucei gambiense DAL972]